MINRERDEIFLLEAGEKFYFPYFFGLGICHSKRLQIE